MHDSARAFFARSDDAYTQSLEASKDKESFFDHALGHLRGHFPGLDAWPGDAQLAVVSLAYALSQGWSVVPVARASRGAGQLAKKADLVAALKEGDFRRASWECPLGRRADARDRAHEAMFAFAARVAAFHDANRHERLVFPRILTERGEALDLPRSGFDKSAPDVALALNRLLFPGVPSRHVEAFDAASAERLRQVQQRHLGRADGNIDEPTWHALAVGAGETSFDSVLAGELAEIDARRDKHGQGGGSPPGGPLAQAHGRKLVGLALSGGGIRSAAFNLGLLQGLAGLGLLSRFDYLSAVSGGGYVGGWLAAWLKRAPSASVNGQLATDRSGRPEGTGAGDPEPIRHIRRHSSYLAPRRGFLSADFSVLWAAYLRNFLLNQLVLLPAIVAVLLAVRLMLWFYVPWEALEAAWGAAQPPWAREPGQLPLRMMAVVAVTVCAVWTVSLAYLFRRSLDVSKRGEPPAAPDRRFGPGSLLWVTLALTFGAALFPAYAPYAITSPRQHGLTLGAMIPLSPEWFWLDDLVVFSLACGFIAGGSFFLAAVLAWKLDDWGWLGKTGGAVTLAGLAGGAMLYGVYAGLHGLYVWQGEFARDYSLVRATAQTLTIGPPLVLLALIATVCLGVGLLRGDLRDELREWWASLCGRLLVAAAAWLAVTLLALYGTALVLWLGPWLGTAVGSGWVLTVASGVLIGKGKATGPGVAALSALDRFRDRLARVVPYVFVAGLLVAVSVLLHFAIDTPPAWGDADDLVWRRRTVPERPPVKVVVTKADDRKVQRQDTTTRTEAADEAEIVGQMYWVGILNTDRRFVPRVEGYELRPHDLKQLEAKLPEESLAALADWDQGDGLMSRQDFETALDCALGKDAPYATRSAVVRQAKRVRSMKFDRKASSLKLVLWLVGCVALCAGMGCLIDVNLFSLHGVYANRLCRAFLGASRPDRKPDPITGFDPDDDLPLHDLRQDAGYDGPYLLANAAMNLVHGVDLAWQERQADSFVFSPLHCGGETTGYRPTRAYAGGLTLGTAVTVSGAAASPNMGYHSSPAVTFLLTVFNARLGAWLGNPAHRTDWRRSGPRFGLLHLFYELFGWTDDRGPYVYLSDGGHFENLGVYELVRRRCRYVVASDVTEDAAHAFTDLGNLIRKVRVDFGIRIEIDLHVLKPAGQPGRCRWHCAVGRIRYDDVDPGAVPGLLVYLKPSLTGDEPADVLHYAEANPAFPHESTGDQFYNESQLESYRALGHHVAEAVFRRAVDDVKEQGDEKETGLRYCRELFASVSRRWFALPPQYEASFLESTYGFIDVQEASRKDPKLWRLTMDLYPELAATLPPRWDVESAQEVAERKSSELRVVAQMLQVMENAWLSLSLEANYAHPMNRGWMDVFHRWTSAPTVRRLWPILRAEFAREFVRFCEKQMRLGEVKGRIVALNAATPPASLARLLLEFDDQWPEHSDELRRRLARACSGDAFGWLVYPHQDYPGEPQNAGGVSVGVVLATPAGGEPSAYDFLVWMRGAYRNTGLGRTAARAALHELPKLLLAPFELRVLLPVAGLTGPGGRLQKGMWLTFFHSLDFGDQHDDPAKQEVRLTRRFAAAPRS